MKHRFAILALASIACAVGVFLVTGPHAADPGPRAERPESLPNVLPHLAGRATGTPSAVGRQLTGVVVNEADDPVPGVVVELRDRQPYHPYAAIEECDVGLGSAWAPPKRPPVRARTVTDETGCFEMAIPDDLVAGRLCAVPGAPRVGTVRNVSPWPRADTHRRLSVWEGRPQVIRVVDAAGRGTRAWIDASRGGQRGASVGAWRCKAQPTDADGRLALLLPPGPFSVSATVPGVACLGSTRVEPPFPDEVLLRLGAEGGAKAHGTVRATDDRPIPDTRIEIYVQSTGDGPGCTRWTRTDADGTWSITDLPSGLALFMNVDASGFAPRELSLQSEIGPDSVLRYDIQLQRACRIEGRVVDAAGRSVAGAGVQARSPAGARKTTADAFGRFRFDGLGMGSFCLRVAPPGWTQAYEWPHVDREQGVANLVLQAEGDRGEVTLVIPRGRDVVGRVVTGDGTPVAEARVKLEASEGCGCCGADIPLPPAVHTDEAGRFAFRGIFAANHGRLHASAEGLLAEPMPLDFYESAGTLEVEVVVRRAASIAGRVVEADGSALSRELLDAGDLWVVARWGRLGGATPVDDDGCFRLAVQAGRYSLDLSSLPGGLDAVPQRVVVDWGEVREGVAIRLEPTLTTAGVVVDARGSPIPGLTLRFEDGGTTGSCVTSADGSFRIEALPMGTHRARFGDDGTFALKEVRAGDRSVRLVHWPCPSHVLAGSVVDADGRPVAAANVTVREAGRRFNAKWLAFQNVRDGVFRVEFRTFDAEVLLEIDDAVDEAGRPLGVRECQRRVAVDDTGLALRLERGLALAGRVVDEAGAPVAGVPLEVWLRSGPRLLTDREGRFRWVGLEPGEVEIEVHARAPWAPTPKVECEVGREDLVVRLRRGWTLRGRVEGPEGEPVGAAHLEASWPGASVSGRCEADGTFALARLGADVVGLSVRPVGGARKSGLLGTTLPDVRRTDEETVVRLERGVYADGSYVEGVVVDPGGVVVAGATVTLRDRRARGTTDDHGLFRIGSLAADLGEVEIRAKGQAPHLGESEPVRVRPPASDVRLVLPRVPVLRGVLVGEGAADFTARLHPASRNRVRSVDIRAGEAFVFADVDSAVRYSLFAHRDGDDRYALAVDVGPGPDPVELRLAPGLGIAGRVLVEVLDEPIVRPSDDEFGVRPPCVRAKGAHGISVAAEVDLDGSFELRGLPPGTYRLEFEHETEGMEESVQTLKATLDDVAAGRRDVRMPLTVEPRR